MDELGSGTQNLTRTPGSVAIAVSDLANNRGSGTVTVETPGLISGQKLGGIFQLNPAATFTVRHTLTGFNLVDITAFGTEPITRPACRGGATSIPCTFQTMYAGSDQQSVYVILSIRVRTPGPETSRKEVNFSVLFQWRLDRPQECAVVETDHVEIVQVTQTPLNLIYMVADKPTAARVFLKLKDPPKQPVAGVTAVLRGFRNGVELTGSPRQPFNTGPLTVFNVMDREQIDHSLNFILPAPWTTEGPIELRAEVRVPQCTAGTRPTLVNGSVSNRFIDLRPGRPLNVSWAPFCYETPESTNRCANESKIPAYDYMLRTLYPLSSRDVYYQRLNIPAPLLYTNYMEDGDLLQPFNDFGIPLGQLGISLELGGPVRAQRFLNFLSRVRLAIERQTRPDHLVGMLPDISSLAGMADLPGRVLMVQQKGRQGLPLDDTQNETHYNANTLAHELGHNYGRRHPNGRLCSAALRASADSDPLTDWPYATADIQHVGFDVENRKVIPANYADLMSYCAELGVQEWLSPHTYYSLQATMAIGPDAEDLPRTGSAKQAAKSAEMQPQIILSGWVRKDGSAAAFDPAYQVNSIQVPPESRADGSHCLQFSGPGAIPEVPGSS